MPETPMKEKGNAKRELFVSIPYDLDTTYMLLCVSVVDKFKLTSVFQLHVLTGGNNCICINGPS